MLSERIRQILAAEIWFEYTRSQGAGGQHVNRTESAVILNWSPSYSKALTAVQIERVIQQLSTKITDAGILKIRSESSRERLRNQQDSLDKFYEMIEKALHIPKARKPTKPSRSSVRKRIESKKIHSNKKELRKKV